MTLPAPGPADPAWGRASGPGERVPLTAPLPPGRPARGLPGGRVVTVATLVVVAAAIGEALATEAIGMWTGVTLIVVAVIAPLVTRPGDRSLPAMMPPLAFLAAALIAGQALLPSGSGSMMTKQALMLFDVLGANAPWVVAATALSVTLSAIRHFADRPRRRS